MELILDEKEVKKLLLEAVNQRFPGSFDEVELDADYGRFRKATFTKAEVVAAPRATRTELLAEAAFPELAPTPVCNPEEPL